MSATKVSNDDNNNTRKPVPNPNADDNSNTEEKEEIVGGQKVQKGQKNTVHRILDVLGKDDNVNRIRNVADSDVTDKWSFDSFPSQVVLYLGDPPKQIDYIRIASENEQPYIIDFANNNILTGYGSSDKGTLKKGLNDIKLPKRKVSRYVRFEFTGNGKKDQKSEPLGIYYIQIGEGEIGKAGVPAPLPPVPTPQPEPEGPPAPTEGRIKNWGGDITKGAKSWKVIRMRDNAKLYKVTDAKGTNIADLFSTPERAQGFIDYHIFKQGKDAGDGEPDVDPNPQPGPGPAPQPGGKGQDQNGVQLLESKGAEVKYDYRENFRDDGKRFDFNVGDWTASEATGYFKFTQNPVDDEVSIKWSEKSHSGSNEVQCYDTGVGIKDGKVRMRFENPHPEYSGNIGSGQGSALGTKWIGYKGVKIPQADGSVLVELYQDTGDNEGAKPANNWKKIYSHKDTKYKRTGAHPYVTIRVDDPAKKGQKNLEAKWLSVAKIG